ncbi:MAG: YiiX/YebB-like N1pC/P60 family cysteine hydrolase [Ferruginibacter sp.]
MKKIKKRCLPVLIAICVLYLLLLIPDSNKTAIIKATEKPFAWNRDDLWLQLENDFKQARQQSKEKTDSAIHTLFAVQETLYDKNQYGNIISTDTGFNSVSGNFFSLASLIAAEPLQRDSFIHLYNKIRRQVKLQSQQWDMNDKGVRNLVYQQLYGMRAAVEEVLLQTDHTAFDPVMRVKDEPSVTPFTNIFGIRVHSGDLLVSRGGAEVSALISRGNDFPGNFSHVALIYVDEKNIPYLIEAHIEKGVAISSVEQYIKDKKLRFMVLRPRADLLQLKQDPMLAQKAAKFAFDEANKRHIPYDFKMDFKDSSAMFCSEVGSYAYRKKGIQLWQAVSTISSQGVVNWLNAFGVENFVTQMPSDLEYDPQLSIVAEWRNGETMYKDHMDNAVMDVLLEEADKGRRIIYSTWNLPLVRIIKGWCLLKNYLGMPAIIPEGMSATQALKNQYFVEMYNKLSGETKGLSDQFIKANHYRPPYWQLVNLARTANEKIKGS